jgi:hypothetical protein
MAKSWPDVYNRVITADFDEIDMGKKMPGTVAAVSVNKDALVVSNERDRRMLK